MYSSWWPAISQRMKKTSNENYVWTLLFLFPLLPVVLSLRDVLKLILSKPKWGAQAVVRGGTPPWPPRNDGTAWQLEFDHFDQSRPQKSVTGGGGGAQINFERAQKHFSLEFKSEDQKRGLHCKICKKVVLAHEYWVDDQYLEVSETELHFNGTKPVTFFGAQSSLGGGNKQWFGGGTAPKCPCGAGHDFNSGLEENSGTKFDPSLGWRPFFWSSPKFRHKTGPSMSEDCFSLVLNLRNSPSYCKFRVTRMGIKLTLTVILKTQQKIFVHFLYNKKRDFRIWGKNCCSK